MGRSLSPLLRQELANLDKDSDSGQSAMKALKSYAKHLDSKNIPQFLAEVSDKQVPPTTPSGECTISLYEVLARVHGKNIVPQIENIMSTIMCTLASSGGSFPLHQACSKVVPAIARYGIEPSTPDEEKTRIIGSLCKPLCDSLMGPQESTASGSALCLKALVESNNWRFASGELVNEVCLKVAGALHEKSTQSNAHMGLVMALVKHNGLIAEAYARSLVRSGLRILEDGSDMSSQKRLSAIQMINFLMKFVDPRSIQSELEKIIEIMEQCQNDRMPFVRGAAFEASQTAKGISGQKGSRHEIRLSPISNASFRSKSPCRSPFSNASFRSKNKSPCRNPNLTSTVEKFAEFASPESQVVESSIKCDSSFDSPISSVGQCSVNVAYNKRSNRRLWNNEKNGVDVSLKDGLFLRGCLSNGTDETVKLKNERSKESEMDQTAFSGFVPVSPKSVTAQEEITPIPQRPAWTIGTDDIKIYSTPRKLFHSLQTSGEENPKCASTIIALVEDTKSGNLDAKADERKELENSVITSSEECEDDLDENESVFSSGDVTEKSAYRPTCEADNGKGSIVQNAMVVKDVKPRKGLKVCFGFGLSFIFLFITVMFLSVWFEDDRNVFPDGFVPT
ncbi:ARM repeat superfamily protein [Rhynchospora pubera]|uniref:ARM repeat superfamily protein n=1 Tax=Rhynchospora pubera TaxID=906938 RepID=A0AAV8FHN7_9POAL|nr:ARM repeat superfamily protein [Rhynchospora pubera]